MVVIRNPWKALASVIVMVPFGIIGFICVILANVFVTCNIGLRHLITWSGEATSWMLDVINGKQEKPNEVS